jgi:hypothetical protein
LIMARELFLSVSVTPNYSLRYGNVLIGNPGIGKSCFQEYVLLRIAQSTSNNFREISKRPCCVIRQIAEEYFQVYESKSVCCKAV